jgi:hypothetical protein
MAVLNKYHYGNVVPTGAINIMRGTEFGNPFVIGQDGDRAAVIALYRRWLFDRIRADQEFADKVRALRGKDVCCCCAPAVCHGDILLAAAEWLHRDQDPA